MNVSKYESSDCEVRAGDPRQTQEAMRQEGAVLLGGRCYRLPGAPEIPGRNDEADMGHQVNAQRCRRHMWLSDDRCGLCGTPDAHKHCYGGDWHVCWTLAPL